MVLPVDCGCEVAVALPEVFANPLMSRLAALDKLEIKSVNRSWLGADVPELNDRVVGSGVTEASNSVALDRSADPVVNSED